MQWAERARQQGEDVGELMGKLRENHLRQQQVLAGVLEKVPEQAQEGILNAIARSSAGLENAIERVQMEQFREELNLQLNNVGKEIRLRIQERIEAELHKQEGVSAGESQQNKTQ